MTETHAQQATTHVQLCQLLRISHSKAIHDIKDIIQRNAHGQQQAYLTASLH